MSGLRSFRLELYEKTTLCAQDKPHHKVIQRLQCVEIDGIKEKELIKPGRKFETLDRKLAVALQSILPE